MSASLLSKAAGLGLRGCQLCLQQICKQSWQPLKPRPAPNMPLASRDDLHELQMPDIISAQCIQYIVGNILNSIGHYDCRELTF